MISTTSLLQFFATTTVLFSAQSEAVASPSVESNFNRFSEAVKGIADNFGPVRDMYAKDAYLKFCWGGDKTDCAEGNVDEVLLPFHDTLKYFETKQTVIPEASSPDVLNIRWSNVMETIDGCTQATSGTATIKFNGEGKVISHLASSDDALRCIPAGSEPPSKFDRFIQAYEALDSDFGPMREIYAPDAYFKFCWGGDKPNCADGTIDEMLLPFHESLQKFKVKGEVITGGNYDDGEVMSVRWNNYMETKHGCGEVTHGVAVVEYNEDGKVSRHYSLSDNVIHCVPEYQTIMAAAAAAAAEK